MSKKKRFFIVAEWILALIFITGGIETLFLVEAKALPGIFAYLVTKLTFVAYGFLFMGLGFSLLITKYLRKKKAHRHTLLAMYLTTVYMFFLSLAAEGVTFVLLRIVAVGILAGFLWLTWKFKTQYINPKDFKEDVFLLERHE